MKKWWFCAGRPWNKLIMPWDGMVNGGHVRHSEIQFSLNWFGPLQYQYLFVTGLTKIQQLFGTESICSFIFKTVWKLDHKRFFTCLFSNSKFKFKSQKRNKSKKKMISGTNQSEFRTDLMWYSDHFVLLIIWKFTLVRIMIVLIHQN